MSDIVEEVVMETVIPTPPSEVASFVPNIELESSKLPKTKRKKSDVWRYFDKVDRPDETGKIVSKAVSKVCNSGLVYGGTHGTSHLARHAVRCCEKTIEGGQQTVLAIGPNGVICSFTFSQKIARQETVRYFVREELPFNKVDKPAFCRRHQNKDFEEMKHVASHLS
ncbi:hypothetical protein FRX31_011733 [Thalictrum thalictroides]|uniref:BED-type domain-containing protein n=1 Tax=Thalictrum thalictroides TaxID=46969 RepID=A0A7J6WP21_THATH|nr:hypothetical protein FRX31_011733 [Thalictrum thalictroides]